jgi:putative oxidoreductase
MEILFILGRLLFGGYFFVAGFKHFKNLNMMAGYAGSKGVPMAKLAVAFSGALILLGGAGILLGVYVRWALWLIILFLLAVTFKMHDYWNITDPAQKMPQKINFDKNMALLGAALMMLMIPVPWIPVLALL